MSDMTEAQRGAAGKEYLRPGWLPTAVVVNILTAGETREGRSPLSEGSAFTATLRATDPPGSPITLSSQFPIDSRSDAETPAFEVIDGQHRLWAFESDDSTDDYYLPVVAFYNLSKTNQAYLFWSINIKPKRINTSLAFDLYPILRSQEWLMGDESLKVYRESRAQELTEALWSSLASPWYDRINMIGSTGVGDTQPVTQASFVRTLMSSFVKKWDAPRFVAGGLFGNSDKGGLDWNRAQQAAYLITSWKYLVDAIPQEGHVWYQEFERYLGSRPEILARTTLLGSDQGVRAYMSVLNEISFNLVDDYKLRDWRTKDVTGENLAEDINIALDSLYGHPASDLLANVATAVSSFDWRGQKGVPDGSERDSRKSYLGSGGYVRLRSDIYKAIVSHGRGDVVRISQSLLERHEQEAREREQRK